METEYTIQEVAKLTGLSIDTLRYYERIELLEPVRRASSGHRRYSQRDLAWIDLLIRLRDTGMPLAQMARFAQLRRQGAATVSDRRIMLEQHQQLLEQRMRGLEQNMAVLQQKIVRLQALEAQQETISQPALAHTQGATGEGDSLTHGE